MKIKKNVSREIAVLGAQKKLMNPNLRVRLCGVYRSVIYKIDANFIL